MRLSVWLVAAMIRGAWADAPVVVLPVKLRGNYPLVTVQILGQEVPLVFDSGNSGSVSLTQAVIDRVKAVPTGEISRGIDAQGNVIDYPKFKIPRLQLGSVVFNDVVAELDVHDPSYPPDQVGQQGFLGTSLLKGYEVVLDYPHARITLVPPGETSPAAACKGAEVPFLSPWHGEPVTEGDIDLGHLTLWWDTGTPTAVLSRRFIDTARVHPSGTDVASKHLILGGVDFGPFAFQVWDVAFPFDGSIGYSFFSRHIVCMDFPNKKLVIPH